MDAVWSLLTLIGSALCHQLEERSYLYDGLQMPLCARCIGIHFGFLASMSSMLFVGRGFSRRLPTGRGMLLLLALAALFLVDAFLSYSGVSESTNLRRTLSGLALGTALPFLILPLACAPKTEQAFGEVRLQERTLLYILAPSYALAALAVLSCERSGPLFYAVSVLGIVGMVALLVAVWSALVSVSLEDRGVSGRMRVLLGSAAALAMMSSLILAHGLI